MKATEAAATSGFRSDTQHQISESFGEETLACGNYSSAEEHNEFHQRVGCSNQLIEGISTTAHAEVFSTIPPPSWHALCNQFRKTYSADLPFVHFPTFLDFLAVGQTSTPIHDLDGSTNNLTGMPLDSIILLLTFFALTVRHFDISFDWHNLREGRARDNLEQSKHCARLSLLYLGNHPSTKRNVAIESVQARLMLASYQWSMCQCISARYILSEANSLLQKVHFNRELSTRRRQKPMSVAHVFRGRIARRRSWTRQLA